METYNVILLWLLPRAYSPDEFGQHSHVMGLCICHDSEHGHQHRDHWHLHGVRTFMASDKLVVA